MNEALKLVTNYDEHLRRLDEAASFDSCCSVVSHYHGQTMARARDFVEAYFWLGAAISRASKWSNYGDDITGVLKSRTGISSETLRNARGFYDTFFGNFDDMYAWVSSWIDKHDRLLKGDIKALVQVNRDRRLKKQGIDQYNRHLEESKGEGYEWARDREYLTPNDLPPNSIPPIVEPSRPRKDKQVYAKVRHALQQLIKSGDTLREVRNVILPNGSLATLRIEMVTRIIT